MAACQLPFLVCQSARAGVDMDTGALDLPFFFIVIFFVFLLVGFVALGRPPSASSAAARHRRRHVLPIVMLRPERVRFALLFRAAIGVFLASRRARWMPAYYSSSFITICGQQRGRTACLVAPWQMRRSRARSMASHMLEDMIRCVLAVGKNVREGCVVGVLRIAVLVVVAAVVAAVAAALVEDVVCTAAAAPPAGVAARQLEPSSNSE